MVSETLIRQAVDILVREAEPRKVILFGSHARGDTGPESDVDLLLVMQTVQDKHAEIARLLRAIRPLGIPVDLMLVSEERLASSWADFPGTYLYDALREGKVLYAVDGTGAASVAQSAR